jgi:hypothetical protein
MYVCTLALNSKGRPPPNKLWDVPVEISFLQDTIKNSLYDKLYGVCKDQHLLPI